MSCFLLFGCNSAREDDKQLIGTWKSVLKDSETGMGIDEIVFVFTEDGKLIQHIGKGEMQHIVSSTYTVEGDQIITTEEQSNEKTRGNYVVDKDTLTISFEGLKNKFLKID